jgi:pimeloyl-ACP methyl ester carboxylesterase
MRAWHMVWDSYLFFPWWKHTAEARRNLGLPETQALHDEMLEMLACIRTYHLSYRAAIIHANEEQLPLITVPTLVACAESDQLFPVLDEAAALVPGAHKAALPSRKD